MDLDTGRPVFTAHADFSQQPKLIYPGQGGAHNWHPMSFNARTGLVYIPALERPHVYFFSPKPRYLPGRSSEHVDILVDGRSARRRPSLAPGVYPDDLIFLQAWDPVRSRSAGAFR